MQGDIAVPGFGTLAIAFNSIESVDLDAYGRCVEGFYRALSQRLKEHCDASEEFEYLGAEIDAISATFKFHYDGSKTIWSLKLTRNILDRVSFEVAIHRKLLEKNDTKVALWSIKVHWKTLLQNIAALFNGLEREINSKLSWMCHEEMPTASVTLIK